MRDTDDGDWHLDKKVPISLIGAILLQTFAFGVYAENLNNRISNLEGNTPTARAELQKLEDARETTNRAVDALAFQTKALDTTLTGQEKHFSDMASALQRLEERLHTAPPPQ